MMNGSGKIMISFVLGWVWLMSAGACNTAEIKHRANQSDLHITAEAIPLNGGWGYKIEVNNHPFIYQNQIPCMAGSRPFPSEKCAMALAHVVMKKIKKGQLPSVTLAEVKEITGINQ